MSLCEPAPSQQSQPRGDGPGKPERAGQVHADGRRLEVGSRDFPTNRGGLCQKGWTSAGLLHSASRLTTPLVRPARGAPLERTRSARRAARRRCW